MPFTIPLDSYHLCLSDLGRAPVITQASLSLIFGKHSVTPLNPPIPRFEPPIHSFRRRSFRVRHRTSATHQIDAPWGEPVKYSWYSQ